MFLLYTAGKSAAVLKKVASFEFGRNGNNGWSASVNIGLNMANRYACVVPQVWAYRSNSSGTGSDSGYLHVGSSYNSSNGVLTLSAWMSDGGISAGGECIYVDVYVIKD